MASQGPNNPSAAVNYQWGTGIAWSNPTNIYASDDARTSCVLAVGESSQYLRITGFGFTIPAGSEILGIVVEVENYATVAGKTRILYLLKDGAQVGSPNSITFLTSEAYTTHGISTSLWGATWTADEINASGFGVQIYAGMSGYTAYIDHVRITVYYTPAVTKTLSDLVASVTESISLEKTTYDYTPASNVKGYILNMKTGGWTYTDNLPFVNAIYRPTTQEIWGARRDKGQLSKINSGSTFDGTPIASIMQTGFMDFGELDEKPVMEAKFSEALKRLSAFFSEVKSEGNLTLTIYTENDSTGKTFTITPATADNTVYNQVRTALSRTIRGKYISFKIINASGQDFWVGSMKAKIIPRGLK